MTDRSEKKMNAAFEYSGRDLEAMAFAENYHNWILEEFRPFIGKRIIEAGAGSGNFSSILLELPVEKLFAFEPSSEMFALLQEKFSENSRVSLFNECFNPSLLPVNCVFNSLIYVNVLEHVENDKKELEICYKSLPSKGCLLIFVPALPCLYSTLDRQLGHFRRYKRNNLNKIVTNAGFRIITSRYFDMPGALAWYLNFKLMNQTLSPEKVRLYDRLIVPILKKLETLKSPPFGKMRRS